MKDGPTARYSRNQDGSYTVTYGNKTVRAKDRIDAGAKLGELIFEYEQEQKNKR